MLSGAHVPSHRTARSLKEGLSSKGAIGRDRPSVSTVPSTKKVEASGISGDYQMHEYAFEAWLSFREKQCLRFSFALEKISTLFKTGLYEPFCKTVRSSNMHWRLGSLFVKNTFYVSYSY